MESGHPFELLAGTWRGRGEGSYPTIADFAYDEEVVIAAVVGRPVARWTSTTSDADTGEARHAESGFLRSTPGGIELVLAHSFGVVEIAHGELDGKRLLLASDDIHATATAKRVDRVERAYTLDGDSMSYAIGMAAVGVPLTHHLAATLHRGSDR